MRVLVVMDPIETVNLKKDSTMAMLWAASRRGHELGYVLQHDLYIDQGKAFGLYWKMISFVSPNPVPNHSPLG